MTVISKAIVAAAFAGLALVKGVLPVSAEGAKSGAFGPGSAISLIVGEKRAIGYFAANSESCDLTLFLADAFSDEVAEPAAPVRVNIAVGAGKTAFVDSAAGKAVAFICSSNATTMSVQPVKRVAYAAPAN